MTGLRFLIVMLSLSTASPAAMGWALSHEDVPADDHGDGAVDIRSDAATRDLLTQAARAMAQRHSFSVEIQYAMGVQRDAEVRYGPEQRLSLRARPSAGEFALEPVQTRPNASGEVTVRSNSEGLFTLSADGQRWHQSDQPRDLESFLQRLIDQRRRWSAGYTPPAQALIGLMWAQDENLVTPVMYLGLDQCRGESVHRIAYRIETFRTTSNFVALIKATPPHVPLRITMVDQIQRAFIERSNREERLARRYNVDFEQWSIDDEIPDSAFTFATPPGAHRVEAPVFVQVDPGAAAAPAKDVNLVGRSVADAELRMLDGSRLPLTDADAGTVVVLDFWATWCAPCLRAMPLLADTVSSYGDKGVTLYAVNAGESRETIESFLEQRDWSLNVAMDQDNRLGRQWGIRALPTTLIIDRDRTVRTVHVGAGEDYEAAIREAIEAALDDPAE